MINNRALEYLLFLVIVVFFYPYLSLGFTTNDDALNQVANNWERFQEISQIQGRVQFLLLHWWLIKISYLINSMLFIKIISIFVVISNLIYASYLVYKATNQRYCSYIFIVVFITFIQDSWNQFLITSSPLIYTIGFLIFLASLHLYAVSSNNNKKQIYSACLFVFSLQISEMFLLFSCLYLLISKYYLNKKYFFGLKYHAIFTIIYIIIYITFRLFFGSLYSGNSVGAMFSFSGFLKTLSTYSLYTIPGSLFLSNSISGIENINNHLNYLFDINLSSSPFLKYIYNAKIIVLNIENLNIIWIFKYLVFIIVTSESLKHIKIFDRKLCTLLLSFSVLLIFLPNVLHALTTKYQQWVLVSNSKGYVGTYISFFGMTLLITTLTIMCNSIVLLNIHIIIRKFILLIIILFTFFISTFISISNEAIYNHKKQSHYKWKLVDKFIKSDVFKNLPKGSKVYSNDLFKPIGIMAQHNIDYWSEYVFMKTGKKVFFTIKLDKKPEIGSYLLKILHGNNDGFLFFSKVKQKNYLIVDEFYLFGLFKKQSIVNYESFNGFFYELFYLKNNNFLLVKGENISFDSININYNFNDIDKSYVIKKPLTKGIIYSQPLKYSFLNGFFEQEKDILNKWSWSNIKSSLKIINTENRVIKINIIFHSGTTKKHYSNLKLSMKNTVFLFKINNKEKEIHASFILKPGDNIIHFSSENSAKINSVREKRSLYFYIKNLVIQETK